MIDKIRKLLALSANNPNEEEAASAMAKARELMLKHGIEEAALRPEAKPGVIYGEPVEANPWQRRTAEAAAQLAGTKSLWYPSVGKSGFLGRPENVAASQLLWTWINDQVEQFYKSALPTGLSQRERAQYRKSFKWACANRILSRVHKIQSRDLPAAQSFALVLVDEVEAKLREDAVPTGKPMRTQARHAEAFYAGRAAGDQVKLNKEVGQ